MIVLSMRVIEYSIFDIRATKISPESVIAVTERLWQIRDTEDQSPRISES
jgi:hypothetical protein